MTINKYEGKTKEEAIEKAKQELGEAAVVLNVKEIKPKGMFKMFKETVYEATVAMEQKEKFTAPVPAKMQTEGISLAADEQITIPRPQGEDKSRTAPAESSGFVQETGSQNEEVSNMNTSEGIEKRLENLSNMLEKQLSVGNLQKEEQLETLTGANTEGFQFMKMLYRTLLENEVNEKYVNQIMEESEKIIRSGSSVDSILSNVYQKLILKFGQLETIDTKGKKPKVVFFIGPTGVGKTTTLAKIASKYKIEEEKSIAFLTADTYRIAATEQLRVYADILDAPMSIVYTAEEMNTAIARAAEYDIVFIDTAGFSHRNETQAEDMKKLIQGLDENYEKEVYLVLSATTKYRDLVEIADVYKDIADYKLIFTKLDETSAYGNILNIKLYSGAGLSYMTTGQNVPDDIEVFDTQKIVKQLLGGR